MTTTDITIGVIGLGDVGLPCAACPRGHRLRNFLVDHKRRFITSDYRAASTDLLMTPILIARPTFSSTGLPC